VSAVIIPLPVKKKRKDGQVYYCLRCDSDIFTLHADGEIHCGNCTSLMRNIRVEKEKSPDLEGA
jgi:DNA-directed RNA polymerase subunit RPC12/RpoP